MVIKVDLEKAYDFLIWDCINETLIDVGLLGNLISIVMKYLTTSSMQLLWNGTIIEEFHPSRGARQGDSISPCLFILYIKRLACLINVEAAIGRWKPILIGRGVVRIPYLLFADDLLLFLEANLGQSTVLKNTLNVFCIQSVLKVSNSKRSISFSCRTFLRYTK